MNLKTPFIVILSLAVVYMAILIKNRDLEIKNTNLAKELESTRVLTQEIRELKKSWDDKTSRTMLLNIINHNKIKPNIIKKEEKKEYLYVEYENLDKESLDFLGKKVFEGSYIIEAFDIKRVNEHLANISLRIIF